MAVYNRWGDTPHGNPTSASEEVAKLRLALNHLSLAELEEQRVVKWDKNSNVVKKGPRFNEKGVEVLNNEC
ncbi:hypothetical protein [Haloarcula amylolytica]|uniref:hypothetical protein n=1 Tax=Haloarcula amylolytica TaxID=396317 RepID=UPI0012674819|nr:hypothetical protein [Haloarcula amylolytica]